MKKSTVINVLTSFCILMFLVTFKALAATTPKAQRNYTTSGCTLVSVTATYPKIAPVFDTCGGYFIHPSDILDFL